MRARLRAIAQAEVEALERKEREQRVRERVEALRQEPR
jgi:hypothetical protein